MNYGSSQQRSIYFPLPYLVKNAVATAYGVQQRRARYGKHFLEAMKCLQDAEYWSSDELRAWQLRRATEFVDDALRNTAYYRSHPEYADAWQNKDITRLPVLNKDEVRSQLRDFYSERLSSLPHRYAHTSGTTGKSLIFPLALACFQREYAFRAFHYRWAGVDILKREPIAFCAGHPVAHYDRARPPFWVHDYANNILYLSSYHLSQANMAAYCRQLDLFAPVMLSGYPSSVYLLALSYRSYKYKKNRLKLRGVFTTSETVLAHQRAVIEEVFGCRVFDAYANSEMCAYAMQCDYAEYHLRLEHSFTEVLDENNEPVGPGQMGRVVTTGFGNPAFPLVRYDIGDKVAVSTNQSCRCGRSGPILSGIVGRVEDYVLAADGRLVGRLDHLFKDSRAVIEAQVVQERVGEVILRIVPTDEYSSRDEAQICDEARLRLGSDTLVRFEYVHEIARTNNGKFPFVLSKLDRGLSQREVLRQTGT
jgi:phenylacetate-CoA ligase